MILLKRFGIWLAAIAAFIFGLLAVIASAKKEGKSEAKVDAAKEKSKDVEAIAVRQVNEAREAAAKESETLEKTIDEQNKINSLGNGDAANKLRNEWSRD